MSGFAAQRKPALRVQRVLLIATLLVLFLAFLQNLQSVRVQFLTVTLDAPLAIVLVGLWVIGFLSGWVFHVVRASERRGHG